MTLMNWSTIRNPDGSVAYRVGTDFLSGAHVVEAGEGSDPEMAKWMERTMNEGAASRMRTQLLAESGLLDDDETSDPQGKP
jgi:hypothetical protein